MVNSQEQFAQVFDKEMKRKIARKDGTSKKTKQDGDDGLALSMIVQKLDFETQRKLSQLNRRLADAVESNAQHQLDKFKRQIRENKYM